MSKQQTLIGYCFKGKYQIQKKLKSGGFASVYLAKDLQIKNRYFALKVMDISSKFYAQTEIHMYSRIKQHKYTHGFVKYYDHGIQNNKYFLVLQLLDKDLDQLIIKIKNNCFSLKSVLMIGLQVLDRLQAFHKIGYLHRDVKPDNLVIGFQQKNKVIYLIDFGLAKRIDQVRDKQKGKLIGSLAFMSCRAHQGKQTGVADDVEGLIYTMIFLLNGSLPWSRLTINSITDTHKILIMKKKITKSDFKNSKIPNKLFEILQNLRQTNIKQPIDYLKIKYQIIDILKESKAQNDFNFDWINIKSISPQKKGRIISPQKIKKEKETQENQKLIQKQIYEVYKFLDTGNNGQNTKVKHQVKSQKEENLQKLKKQEFLKKGNQKFNEKLREENIKSSIQKNRDKQIKQNKNKNEKQITRPKSSIKIKRNQSECQKGSLWKNIQLIGSMKYESPNIVINKTAKHKI